MSQPQGLTRLEIARGLRWANWDAVFFTLFVALTSGAFQIGLARFFGANDLWIGIITSVPSLAGALQILTAYLADTAPSQKRLVIRYAFYSRLPFVAIAFLPFLGDAAPRLQLFAGLLILSAVLGSFAGPAFLAWLSALVPPDYRGRYFGRRNMILGLVSAASALPPAIFLDQAVKYQRFSEALAFAVLYGLGALFLFLSLWALRKMPEPPRTPAERKGLRGFWAFYREPFRTPNFRALLGFNTFLVFGQMFAGQFFTVYMLEQIRMPYLMVQVAGLIAALFSSLAMPLWGYLADKFGNKPLLVLSMWGVVFLPYLWFLTDPDRYLWSVGVILFIQVLAGTLWAGVGLTQFNLNVAVAPSEQRAIYMGALSAIVSLMGGLAAFASGALMEVLKPFVPDPTRFFVLFGAASLFRLLALPWLRAIREPDERSTRYVLSQLRASVRPRGWRAMRQLRGQADVATRLHCDSHTAGGEDAAGSGGVDRRAARPHPRGASRGGACAGRDWRHARHPRTDTGVARPCERPRAGGGGRARRDWQPRSDRRAATPIARRAHRGADCRGTSPAPHCRPTRATRAVPAAGTRARTAGASRPAGSDCRRAGTR
jgi:MFS family permease